MAKIMLIEAVGINPDFDKRRMETTKESYRSMEAWFKRFKQHHSLHIPDERAAALILEGTFYYLINDWLESDQSVRLIDSGYALCIYNLQALTIPFNKEEVKGYIKEVYEELTQKA